MNASVVLGSGAHMEVVTTGAAALVLTGPPYWPPDLEAALRRPPARRERIDTMADTILAFALTLRPVLEESFRVLRPEGALVMQTRDIRFGDRQIPLAGAHRGLAEQAGFDLFTRYLWLPDRVEPDRWREVGLARDRGRPRGPDPEEFLVFVKPGQKGTSGEPSEEDLVALSQPLLRTKRGRLGHGHRHQTPLPVCALFVRAFTQPGDLVVDPFAGHGTTLVVAQRLGRAAMGWDIDPFCIAAAERNLAAPSPSNSCI